MAQVLELAHLVQQHGVADVQVRRGGVEPGLDPQGPAPGFHGRGEPGFQLLALEDFVGAAADQFKCCCVWQGTGFQINEQALGRC